MMKGNKSMMLLVVLALLIGIYFIVKFTGNSGRSKSFKSELVTFDNDQVTKLEIMSPEDTTVLNREGDSWKVGEYVADPATVTATLSTLKGIKPSRLASRSKDTWKDFQVDDSGTRVVTYEGDEKVLDIVLGRFNVEGQRSFYSYVRLTEEKDVYVAKDFMKMSVSTGSAAYRNDDILKINKDSITAIHFNYPDSAFSLSKNGNKWFIDGSEADSAAVADYLGGLRFVNSRNFAPNPGAPVVSDLVFQIGDEDLQVSAHSGGGLSSSSNTNEYWVDPAISEKLFKSKVYFITE
tara:strand:- start:1000 stop:1878 length:879 start_codon:yes stop_codon:yes gene_type:complete